MERPTSPGSTSARAKMSSDARISVGTIKSNRRPMRRSIPGPYVRSRTGSVLTLGTRHYAVLNASDMMQ